MRLIKRHEDGSLSLTRVFYNGDIPPYAILSHTWSLDEDEEVAFEDFNSDSASQKPGYRKIAFCAEQAYADVLDYCWIDTCCINRNSEAELSQAIRSMFRWYSEADRCYVYLADISWDDAEQPSEVDAESITNSRWFERGWTVQELLAPSCVKFFTSNGRRLGDRKQLGTSISRRTGIPEAALHGAELDSFTIEQRRDWFKGRQTKREEDTIYATLGLFSVHMPIMYGEGAFNARKRLNQVLYESMSRRSIHVPKLD